MSGVQWPALAIGFALAVAILTALWKAARLRGDANREWSPRIGVVEAGLTQQAIGSLSILRRQIDDLIGGTEDQFDPNSATADPARLLQSVRKFERCMSARRRARRFFAVLLWLGPCAGIALLLLLACDVLGTLHYSNVLPLPGLQRWVKGGALLAVVMGMVVIAGNWYLQQQLTDAEMLSGQDVVADD